MWELWVEWMGTGWGYIWKLVFLGVFGYFLRFLWRAWIVWRKIKDIKGHANKGWKFLLKKKKEWDDETN